MPSDRDSVIEMQHINPVGNNDSSIDELFEQQCVFSIADNEVKRIQHAVEIMIRFILTCIYENTSFVESMFCEQIVKHASFKSPLNIYYTFKDEHLLKVGSFYENTKNHFPDEFDFVCVLAECDESDFVLMKELTTTMADKFHNCLRETVLKPCLAGTCIEFMEYKGLHGPAAKLEFRYVNWNSDETRIFVDISPASRVKMQGHLPSGMNIKHPEWNNGVVAMGSLLLLKFFSEGHPKRETRIRPSICEFEHFYMLNELSEKHRRVYRLLKHLLNDESIREELHKLVKDKGNHAKVVLFKMFYPRVIYDFSSYVIKTLMFHHCLHCHMSVTTTSQCVTSVLDHILKLFKTEEKDKARLRMPFSVSIETMTGEHIEIADSYRPAMKIKKSLKKIRNDVLENRVTESIPLAKEMLPVVKKHMKERKVRKRRCQSIVMKTISFAAFACSSIVLFLLFKTTVIEQHMRLYWNGTDYLVHMNNSLNVNTYSYEYIWSNLSNSLSVNRENSTATINIRELFCLDYNNNGINEDQKKKMRNVSKSVYNGSHNSSSCLSDDINYLIKVERHGIEQQFVCHALAAEKDLKRITPTPNTRSDSETESELVCLQNVTTCLDIQRKYSLFGYSIYQSASSCEEQQPCLQIFSNQSKSLHCNISKQLEDTNKTTQTEISCCEGHSCVNLEYYAEEHFKEEGQLFVGIIVITLFITCFFGCVYLCPRIEYCMYQLRRRNLKYINKNVKRIVRDFKH